MTLAVALLLFVSAQRGLELVIARRNTARLIARGGVELAPGHYPLIVLLHASWLATLWLLGAGQAVAPFWFGLYVLLQAFRVWILLSLGSRWTTRIIVVPGERLVRRGPYRWISHPNYLLVVLEIAVLPLALGLPWTALIFSLLNAAVLTIRIRAEERGLRSVRA